MLLCAGLAWTAQRSRAAWDAAVEAELAALRAEGLSADFTAIHPTSPDPYSEALVRIGQGHRDLPLPSAVLELQGCGLGLLRAALADPDSEQARLAYYPRFEGYDDLVGRSPPTLVEGIAVLQSGCKFLDAAFDLLEAGDEPCSLPVPWEEGRLDAAGPVLERLHQVSSRLQTRAALAWIAGDPERGWDFVLRALTLTRRHVRQPGLLGALLGTMSLQIRLETVLQHLEAGPAPRGEQRAALLAELAALDELESLEFSLRGEVCNLLLAHDRDPAETIRFGLRDASPLSGLIGPEPKVNVNPLTLRWLQATELPRWRHDMVARMAAALRLMQGAHPAEGYRSLQDLNNQPATPLAASVHYWEEAYCRRINALATLRLTRIALALAEGAAPPDLEDPWGPPGSRLRAEPREAGGWLLWSRGCDGEDAGGRVKSWPEFLRSGVICEPGGLTDDGVGAGFDLVVFFAPPAPQSSKRKADQSPPK